MKLDWREAQARVIGPEGAALREYATEAVDKAGPRGDLIEAVRSAIAGAGLNKEATARVCELTNNEALLRLLESDEDRRTLAFNPIKVDQVLGKTAPPPVAVLKVASAPAPRSPEPAMANISMEALAGLIAGPHGVPGLPKVAAAPIPTRLDLARDLQQTHRDHTAAVGHVVEVHDRLLEKLSDVAQDVREMVLKKAPLNPIKDLLKTAGVHRPVIREALLGLPSYQEIVLDVHPGGQLELNPDHPFLGKLAAVVEIGAELRQALQGRQELHDQEALSRRYLREHADA